MSFAAFSREGEGGGGAWFVIQRLDGKWCGLLTGIGRWALHIKWFCVAWGRPYKWYLS